MSDHLFSLPSDARRMTALTRFRDHCRAMATAEHKPECPMLTAVEPYWPPGGWVATDGRDEMNGLSWLGPKPAWTPPHCDGCNSAEDRALFARLADEVDDYEGAQMALWETV